MNILEDVKKLSLPAGKYIVIGSGPMAARNIRGYEDIDILVTDEIFEEFSKKKDWQTFILKDGSTVLKKGIYELGKVLGYGTYCPNKDEIIQNAEMIEGIPFLSLEELIKFKKALGRGKDFNDINLIKEYLKNHARN